MTAAGRKRASLSQAGKIFPANGQTVKDVGAVKRAFFALFAFVVALIFAGSTAPDAKNLCGKP
jgi:hypothetical protein